METYRYFMPIMQQEYWWNPISHTKLWVFVRKKRKYDLYSPLQWTIYWWPQRTDICVKIVKRKPQQKGSWSVTMHFQDAHVNWGVTPPCSTVRSFGSNIYTPRHCLITSLKLATLEKESRVVCWTQMYQINLYISKVGKKK